MQKIYLLRIMKHTHKYLIFAISIFLVSLFMQMFSSHPETQKRADRVKEKADEYVKSKQ